MTMKYIAFITLFFLVACGGPSEISDEIEGIYKFKYPSGQVEILDMKKKQSYNQKIYATESDYLNGAKPLYDNNGNWYTKDNELNFNNWLEYCYMGRDIDSILVQPEHVTMLNCYYNAPNSEHNGRINFYLENGYVFKKVDK